MRDRSATADMAEAETVVAIDEYARHAAGDWLKHRTRLDSMRHCQVEGAWPLLAFLSSLTAGFRRPHESAGHGGRFDPLSLHLAAFQARAALGAHRRGRGPASLLSVANVAQAHRQ